MADNYCNDGGSDTSPYETLAKAANLWTTVVGVMSADENLFVVDDTVDTDTASLTLAFPGTIGAPNKVVSIAAADESYSKASVPNLERTSAGDITITGHVYFYGISIAVGDDLLLNGADMHQHYEDVTIKLTGTGSSIQMGNGSGGNSVEFKNVDVEWSNSGNGFAPVAIINFVWDGGTLSFTGSMMTYLFEANTRRGNITARNLDLSVITTQLVDMSGIDPYTVVFSNCILNSGVTPIGTIGCRASTFMMVGCDDTTGNDLYRMLWATYWGTVVDSDAIYRTAGASDGVTNISWKMVTNASAVEFSEPLVSPWFPAFWVNSTGSTTFTFYIDHDSVTDLNDDDIWPEIQYFGSSANTGMTIADGRMADFQATPAAQSSSTEGWTGTGGFTNENKQEVAITVTINRVGYYMARMMLAKPSYTAYVCPLPVIS